MRVAQESPNQPDVIALIADLDAYQDSLYPSEGRYALDLASLSQPNVTFMVARTSTGAAVGCGAVVFGDDYGELKRMFVSPGHRGNGVAAKILMAIEAASEEAGYENLFLETGPYQPEALRFYERHGYRRCAAFGSYPEHPLSVFMSKRRGATPLLPPTEA
jgi:putative acetyltransferase